MPRWTGPPVTANHVTILRIVLLPVPCAMVLYAPVGWHWWAIVLFAGLGFTDMLDGWMARRWGGSVLGALLDPVADKVFMAAALVLCFGLDLVHPAVLALMVFRDFVITSLRSAMSLRGRHVKTSILAKLKTAVQMGGVAMVYIVYRLPDDGRVLPLLGAIAGLYLAFAVWRRVATHEFRPLVWVPACMALLAFLIRVFTGPSLAQDVYWGIVVAFTVASAVDYFGVTGAVLLRGSGRRLDDLGRILWSVVAGIGLPWFMVERPETAPLCIVLLATEFTSGAVDNLRCHEGFLPYRWVYPLRAAVLAAGGWLVLTLAHDGRPWSPAFWGTFALAGLMLLWTVLDFVVARNLIWGEEATETEQAKGVVGR
ncbi:MAG: CDP-alcohol phosphatidyltransferase family protein [Deltaproteobacteria bacterium]|nr:CDP-alcohol phosphatidyltransferase family protein [Deltaproteobacteria bacterium]